MYQHQRNLREKMNFRFLTESEIKRSVPLNFKPEKCICLPQCLVSINDSALAGLWLSLNWSWEREFQTTSLQRVCYSKTQHEREMCLDLCYMAKKSYSPLKIIVKELYTVFVIRTHKNGIIIRNVTQIDWYFVFISF